MAFSTELSSGVSGVKLTNKTRDVLQDGKRIKFSILQLRRDYRWMNDKEKRKEITDQERNFTRFERFLSHAEVRGKGGGTHIKVEG